MSISESASFWDKTAKFVGTHRAAIAITAAVGASTAAGAYYYLNSGSNTESVSSKKKKKSKKKKSGSANGAKKEDSAALSEDLNLKALLAEAVFPYDQDSLSPKIDDALVSTLTLKQKEDYAVGLKETGNALFKTKQYEKAIEYYTAALKCKEDAVFYSNRSACYSYLENHEKVIEDTTKAIKLKPDYIKCLMRRSQSYALLENYPDAMFDLTAVTIYGGANNRTADLQLEKILKEHSTKIVEAKLVNHKPSLPTASSITPFFGAFQPEAPIPGVDEDNLEEGSADYFLVEAIKQVAANTSEGYDAADVLIKQAAERYGKSLTASSPEAKKAAIAYEYLGAFDFLKNNSDLAINNILYAIALNPRPRLYVILGLIYADRQEIENATKQFDAARQLDPNNPDVFYHLGQLLYLSNNLSEAAAQFEKAKELNPKNMYSYIQLACILYREGKILEADKKFAEAKKEFPLAPEIPNYYGEILSDKQDLDGAIKQFTIAAKLQAALDTFSIGAVLLINKATLVSRTDIFELEKILSEALKVDPKSELARMTLAQVKLQLEETKEAVKLFEELSDLARSYSEKLQATQFAELAKMQVRLREDPVLSLRVQQLIAELQAAGAYAQAPMA